MRSVALKLSFLFLILLTWVGFFPKNSFADPMDDTTCWVRSGCDDAGSIDAFNCLRQKIENGYNQKKQRSCVDQIIIAPQVSSITLKKPLVIDNDQDTNCEGDSPACQDDYGLILKGNHVDIHVEDISGECGVTVKSNAVELSNINFIASSSQVAANKVLCDEGEGNEFEGVTINGEPFNPHPAPSPSPTPTPTPIPPTPPVRVPVAPENFIGTAIDHGSIQLNWTYSATEEIAGFRLQRSGPGCTDNTYTQIALLPKESRDYTDSGLAAETKYCYRVQAYILNPTAADSSWTRVEATTLQDNTTPPPAPTDLVATPIDDQGIKVTWQNGGTEEITGYRLDRSEGDCTAPNFVQVALIAKEMHEFVDSGLKAETTYCYQIQAYVIGATSVDSEWSPGAEGTTLPDDGKPPIDPNDIDGDGKNNADDNCPELSNSGQENMDGDTQGDVCDDDADGDGVSKGEEASKGTSDLDKDSDDDGSEDGIDNCPMVPNADQANGNGGEFGDACEVIPLDDDGDTVPNDRDNCPQVANQDQHDTDEDDVGDACDIDPSGNDPFRNAPLGGGGCTLLQPVSASSSLHWVILIGIIALPFLKKYLPMGRGR